MSDAHPNIGVDESRLIRSPHGVMAEPDDVKMRAVVVVGAISLVLFFLSGLWAWWLMERFSDEVLPTGPMAAPTSTSNYEVGIVNQRPFDLDYHAKDKLTQQAKSLNSYGYVDPQAGRVHVPVAVAMQEVIAAQPAQPNAQMQQVQDAGTPADAGTPLDGGTGSDAGR